jgi:hypothetical protein
MVISIADVIMFFNVSMAYMSRQLQTPLFLSKRKFNEIKYGDLIDCDEKLPPSI